MGKLKLTPDNIKFIKANRLKMSGTEMAKVFGIDKNIVTRYMRNNGLSISKQLQIQFRVRSMEGKTTSTPEMDKIIKAEYLNIPSKRLAKQIGKSDTFLRTRMRQLGLVIPSHIIEQRKLDSRRKKGDIPVNKGVPMSPEVYAKAKRTMFKKGHKPHNTKEKNGVIVTRHDHPDRSGGRRYKYIRVSLGKWELYHQYLWVKKYGKYDSQKFCLWFKDGDSLNCDLDNLELITRKENRLRNLRKYRAFPDELKTVITLNNKFKKLIHDTSRENTAGAS